MRVLIQSANNIFTSLYIRLRWNFHIFLIFFIRIDNPLEVDTFLLFFLSGKKSNILKIGKLLGNG